MRMGKLDAIIAIVLIVGISVGAYFYLAGQPEAESVLSFDRIQVANTEDVGWHVMEGGYYKTEVSGKWIAYLALDHPTAVDFMDTMEADASDSQYGEGAEFRAKERVRLEFEPKSAYAIGDTELWMWSYSDAGEYNWKRVFPWYELSNWEGVAVPYNLTLKKGTDTLTEVSSETITVGPSFWEYAQRNVNFEEYGSDILSINNLAISSTGEYLPTEDVALIWTSNDGKKLVKASQLKTKLQSTASGDYSEPTFGYNAVDSWSEFVNNCGLDTMSSLYEMEEMVFRGRFDGSLPNKYIGSGGTSNVKKLWWEYVPHTGGGYPSDSVNGTFVDDLFPNIRSPNPSDIPLWNKEWYYKDFPWLADIDGSWQNEIVVEADAQKFDTVVWLPPSGDFEITNVYDDITFEDGSTGELVVKAKNVGDTPATGIASIETPSGIMVQGSEARKTVKPDETAVFTFQLQAQIGNDSNVTKTGSVTVETEKGTGTPSTKSWSVTVEPSGDGGDGDVETGKVSGAVVDAETGDPISGVTVRTDRGTSSVTDETGQYTITNVQEGTRTLTAYAANYETTSVKVTVEPNTMNGAPQIAMIPSGGLPWLWIGIAVIVIVSSLSIALIIMHEKGLIG